MGFQDPKVQIRTSAEDIERRKLEQQLGAWTSGVPTSSNRQSTAEVILTGRDLPSPLLDRRQRSVSSSDIGDDTEIPGVGRGVPRQDSWEPAARQPLVEISQQRLPSSIFDTRQEEYELNRERYLSISTRASARSPQIAPTNQLSRDSQAMAFSSSRFGSPRKGAYPYAGRSSDQERAHARSQGQARQVRSSEDDDDDTDDSDESGTHYRHEHRFAADNADSTGNHEALRATPVGASLDSRYERGLPLSKRPTLREEDILRLERLQAVERLQAGAYNSRFTNAQSTLVDDPKSPFANGTAKGTAAGHSSQRSRPPLSSPEQPPRMQRSTASPAHVSQASRNQLPQAGSQFEALANGLRREMAFGSHDRPPRVDQEVGDGSNSGSGFGAGSHHSSVDTKVDEGLPFAKTASAYDKYQSGLYLPSGQRMGAGIPISGVELPDITGMSSAFASPVKSRVGVKHVAIGADVMGVKDDIRPHIQLIADRMQAVQAEVERQHERMNSLESQHRLLTVQVQSMQTGVMPSGSKGSSKAQGAGAPFASRSQEDDHGSVSARPTSVSRSEHQAQMHSHSNSSKGEQTNVHEAPSHQGQDDAVVRELQQQIADLSADLEHSNKEMARLRKLQKQAASAASRPNVNRPSREDSSLQDQINALREHLIEVAAHVSDLSSLVQSLLPGFSSESVIDTSRRQARRSTGAMRGYGSEGDRDDPDVTFNRTTPRARFSAQPALSSPIKKSTTSRIGRRSPFVPIKPTINSSSEREYRSWSASRSEPSRVASRTAEPEQRSVTVHADHAESLDEDDEVYDQFGMEDLSVQMQERADATIRDISERVSTRQPAGKRHCSHTKQCSICARQKKETRRDEAKREKLKELERQRVALEKEEAKILAYIDASTANDGDPLAFDTSDPRVLVVEHILDEMLDEFWHQVQVHKTLSKEVARMSPLEYRHQVTTRHAKGAITTLEALADRIRQLHSLLPEGSAPPTTERQERKQHDTQHVASPANTPKSRTATHGRERESTSKERSTPGSSRLRQAPSRTARSVGPMSLRDALNNSPPTVDE